MLLLKEPQLSKVRTAFGLDTQLAEAGWALWVNHRMVWLGKDFQAPLILTSLPWSGCCAIQGDCSRPADALSPQTGFSVLYRHQKTGDGGTLLAAVGSKGTARCREG